MHGSVTLYLTYLGIAQPVNTLGAICVIVCEDVGRERLLLVNVESRSAELDVVMDELVGCVVGDALRRRFGLDTSCFEAALALHGAGQGQTGQGSPRRSGRRNA